MTKLNETEAAIVIAVVDELSNYYNEEAWQSYYEQWYEEEYTEEDWFADNCEQFEDDKWV